MSGPEASKLPAVRFENTCPILRVRSLQASLDYYTKVLGFKVDWGHESVMASVGRDRAHIMLCEGDQGNPGTWVWVGVEDAERFFRSTRPLARGSAGADQLSVGAGDPRHGPRWPRLAFRLRTEENRPFDDWVFWYRDRDERDQGLRDHRARLVVPQGSERYEPQCDAWFSDRLHDLRQDLRLGPEGLLGQEGQRRVDHVQVWSRSRDAWRRRRSSPVRNSFFCVALLQELEGRDRGR